MKWARQADALELIAPLRKGASGHPAAEAAHGEACSGGRPGMTVE